jgi:chromosome segregation ATPase
LKERDEAVTKSEQLGEQVKHSLIYNEQELNYFKTESASYRRDRDQALKELAALRKQMAKMREKTTRLDQEKNEQIDALMTEITSYQEECDEALKQRRNSWAKLAAREWDFTIDEEETALLHREFVKSGHEVSEWRTYAASLRKERDELEEQRKDLLAVNEWEKFQAEDGVKYWEDEAASFREKLDEKIEEQLRLRNLNATSGNNGFREWLLEGIGLPGMPTIFKEWVGKGTRFLP